MPTEAAADDGTPPGPLEPAGVKEGCAGVRTPGVTIGVAGAAALPGAPLPCAAPHVPPG